MRLGDGPGCDGITWVDLGNRALFDLQQSLYGSFGVVQ